MGTQCLDSVAGSIPTTDLHQVQGESNTEVVNIQPVVPFKVSDGLTLVTRTIVPFISQPWARGTSIQSLGDINPSVFFVPTLKGNFTVGVGPTMIIPSATDNRLSSQRWSAGPTGVLVYTKGPIVAGGLINNVWSFAGDGKRDVNKMLIQPFLNYNLPKGWYLTSSPIITADWTSEDNKGWTVPVCWSRFWTCVRVGHAACECFSQRLLQCCEAGSAWANTHRRLDLPRSGSVPVSDRWLIPACPTHFFVGFLLS